MYKSQTSSPKSKYSNLHDQELPQQINIPSSFFCPITNNVMDNPVVALPSGEIYENAAILNHLSRRRFDFVNPDIPLSPEQLREKPKIKNDIKKLKSTSDWFQFNLPKICELAEKIENYTLAGCSEDNDLCEPMIPAVRLGAYFDIYKKSLLSVCLVESIGKYRIFEKNADDQEILARHVAFKLQQYVKNTWI